MSDFEFENSEFRDFRVPEEKHDLYVELKDTTSSPLHDTTMTDIFLLAFGYGYKKAGRESFKNGRALFQRSSLNTETYWIMKAVAIDEVNTSDILIDNKEIRHITEEYACGGITELHNTVFAPGDGLIALSDDLIALYNFGD